MLLSALYPHNGTEGKQSASGPHMIWPAIDAGAAVAGGAGSD